MTENSLSDSTSLTVLAIIIALNVGICLGLVLSLLAGIPTIQLYILAAIEFAAIVLVYSYSKRSSTHS